MAMKLPYLTARNAGIMELLKENETCLAFTPADSSNLAEKMIWAKNNPDKIVEMANAAHQLYQRDLTPRALAAKALERFKKR